MSTASQRRSWEAKMRVLIYYKGERRFKALEVQGLECTPYSEEGRVVVRLYTPTGDVVLEAEGDEWIVEGIREDLLSEDKYVVQAVIRDVVRERYEENEEILEC